MSRYYYQCFDCKKIYAQYEIEKELIYLCPSCGKSERNRPLVGVLEIKYDYSFINKTELIKKIEKALCGAIWEFPEIIPLQFDLQKNQYLLIDDKILNSLRLSSTPLIRLRYKDCNLFAFDDTRNPTFSYKDRASILVVLKAIQLGINEISAASTGNAGSSIAGICARFGLKSHIFVPKTIPEAKRIQIQAFGSNIYVVDGTYDEAFDLCLTLSGKKNWFNRNTAFNPLTIEGKKSGAYDIFMALKKIPDNIFIPVGDGVIIGGLYKGFKELLELGIIEKLPRLVAVQSKGSNAIVRFHKTKKFEFHDSMTIADSICASAPRNLFMADEAIKRSDGFAVEVSDDEIITAQKEIIQRFGIFVEPSSAATFAGFKYAINAELISEHDLTLLMFTGNGLKDLNSLKVWNKQITVKKFDEWLDEFKVKI